MADETAYLAGSSTLAGDFNPATASPIDWSDAQTVGADYAWSSGTPSVLTVQTAGDYLVSVNASFTGSTDRASPEITLAVNGTQQLGGVTRCGYMRPASGHDASSDHLVYLLTGLSVGDEITVRSQQAAAVGSVSGSAAFFIERIEDAPAENVYFGQATATTWGNEINRDAEESLIFETDVRADNFTHSTTTAPESVTVDRDGWYLVALNVPMAGAALRVNIYGRVKVNGATVGTCAQGYIRNSDGHEESSVHYVGFHQLSAGDVLTATTQREATSGIVTVGSSAATLLCRQIDPADLYVGEGTTVEDASADFNPATAASVELTTDEQVAPDYTHSTTTNPETVTVGTPGEHIAAWNVPLNHISGDARASPHTTLLDDGIETPASSECTYLRTIGDHFSTSAGGLFGFDSLGGAVELETVQGSTPAVVEPESTEPAPRFGLLSVPTDAPASATQTASITPGKDADQSSVSGSRSATGSASAQDADRSTASGSRGAVGEITRGQDADRASATGLRGVTGSPSAQDADRSTVGGNYHAVAQAVAQDADRSSVAGTRQANGDVSAQDADRSTVAGTTGITGTITPGKDADRGTTAGLRAAVASLSAQDADRSQVTGTTAGAPPGGTPTVARPSPRTRTPGGMVITDHDTVPLPTETIREREPVELTLYDHPAWPGRPLHIYMDWNPASEQWIWRVESELPNQSGLKTVIPMQPAHYGAQYQYRSYFLFTFLDLSRGSERVTPKTLGNTVDLIGYPGPRSPGWRDWVARQSFQNEAARDLWLNAADDGVGGE